MMPMRIGFDVCCAKRRARTAAGKMNAAARKARRDWFSDCLFTLFLRRARTPDDSNARRASTEP
jgi:hypothetical protein